MRTCIFCNGTVITGEHAWPRWILRSVVGRQQQTHIEAQLGPERLPKLWRGSEIKVKYVCSSCNNGWMSELESLVRRIIGPLVADLSIRLNHADQWLMSIWSLKTAMVFECTNPTKDWFYSGEDRQELVQSISIPADTTIWIGRLSGDSPLSGEGRKLFCDPRHASPFSGGYVSTFGVGRLAIQILTTRKRPGFEQVRTTVHLKRGPWGRLLTQIWPITKTTVRWPPAASFSRSGISLDELCERFIPTRRAMTER